MSLDIAVIILLSIYVALMRRYLFPARWRRQGGKPRYEKAYANLGVPIEAQPAPYPYAAQRPATYEAAHFAMPRYDFPIIAEENEEDEEREETAQQHATPQKQPAEAKAVSPERREGPTGDSGAKQDRRPPAKVQTAGSPPDRARHRAAAGKPRQQLKVQVRPQPQVQPRPLAQTRAQQQPKPTAHVKPQVQAQPKPKPQAKAQAQVRRPSPAAPGPAPITQVRQKPLLAAAKPQPRPVRPAAPAPRTTSSAAPAKAAPAKAPAKPRHVKWQSKKGRPFAKPAPKPVKPAPQPTKPAHQPARPMPRPAKPAPKPARPAPQPARAAPVAKSGPLPGKTVMPPRRAAPPPKKAVPPQPLPARSAAAPVKPARPAPAAPAQPGGGRGVDGRKALDLAGAVVAAITRGAHREVYRRMGRTYREAVSEEVLGAMIEQMNAAHGGARAQTPAGSEVVSGARPGGAGNAGLTFRYSVRTGNGPRPFFVQIVREGDTLVCADFFYG